MRNTEATKYLEECASGCLGCGLVLPFRRPGSVRVVPSDERRPEVRITCQCPACHRRWVEVYRLQAIEPANPGD